MQLAGLQSWLLNQPTQELVPRGIAAFLLPFLSPLSLIWVRFQIALSDSGPELYPVSKAWLQLGAL